jgi:hypothetical protein
MVNERRWLALVFSLYFVLAAGYSLLMPIWEAPDEAAHYHLALSVARRGGFPTVVRNYEAHQPRAYYYIAAQGIKLMDEIDPRYSDYYLPETNKRILRVPEPRYDWNAQNYRLLLGVYLLRWMGILFGGISLWLNWKTFAYIENENANLRIAALSLAALTPQYLHIMASVNNDTLGTLAGAMLFYLAASSLKTGSVPSTLLSVFFAVLFPLVTKITVLPVGLAALLALSWNRLWRGSRKNQIPIIAGIVLAIPALSLAFYSLAPQAALSAWNEISWRLFSFRDEAFTRESLEFILGQIVWTYWGLVGWLAIGLPQWMVSALTLFGMAGMVLSAYLLVKRKSEFPNRAFWALTWLVALVTIGAVVKNGLTTIASQGRFLFPAIGAISLLMVFGWYRRAPPYLQNKFPLLVTLIMLLCNFVVWQFGVLPVYFQPFLDA